MLVLALGSCDSPSQVGEVVERVLTVEVGGYGAGTVTSQPAGIACSPGGAGTCSLRLPEGTSVTLTGTAEAGSQFAGWSQGCTGQGACSITLTVDRTIGASFDHPGIAGARIGPAGGVLRSRDGKVELAFPAGALATSTDVTITQTQLAEAGPLFAPLQGAAGLEVRAYRLGPSGATFQHPVRVTVTAEPNVAAPGTLALPDWALLTVREGRVEPLDHLRIEASGSAVRFSGELTHFSPLVTGTDRENGLTFSVGADGVPAIWEVGAGDFPVTLSVTVGNVGNREPEMEVRYLDRSVGPVERRGHGAEISLPASAIPDRYHATPAYGCGDAGMGALDGEFTIRGSFNVSREGITFLTLGGGDYRTEMLPVALPLGARAIGCTTGPRLVVLRVGAGDGTVTSEPDGIQCGTICGAEFAPGTRVTLTALPDPGSVFVRWEDDCSGTASRTEVVVDRARLCEAHFDRLPAETVVHELAVTLTGSGEGDVRSDPAGILCPEVTTACSAGFAHGTMVSLQAEPGPGSVFVEWGGDCVDDPLLASVAVALMDRDRTCTARFEHPAARLVIDLMDEIELPEPTTGAVAFLTDPPTGAVRALVTVGATGGWLSLLEIDPASNELRPTLSRPGFCPDADWAFFAPTPTNARTLFVLRGDQPDPGGCLAAFSKMEAWQMIAGNLPLTYPAPVGAWIPDSNLNVIGTPFNGGNAVINNPGVAAAVAVPLTPTTPGSPSANPVDLAGGTGYAFVLNAPPPGGGCGDFLCGLVAVNVQTAQREWTVGFPSAPSAITLTEDRRTAYVGAVGAIHEVDLLEGRLTRTVALPGEVVTTISTAPDPAWNDYVFFTTPEDLRVLNWEDPSEVTSVQLGAATWLGTLRSGDGTGVEVMTTLEDTEGTAPLLRRFSVGFRF